jgi:hypothetical protein
MNPPRPWPPPPEVPPPPEAKVKVTVSRIVHYVLDDGRHVPGIVTEATDDLGNTGMTIFFPPSSAADYHVTMAALRAPYSERMQPATWHWPEREE